MDLKGYLSVGGLCCDLAGGFLLAVPMLTGTDNALRWVLRLRRRLRLRGGLLFDRSKSYSLTVLGGPEPGDLEREAAGAHVELSGYFMAASLIAFLIVVTVILGRSHFLFTAFFAVPSSVKSLPVWVLYPLYPLYALVVLLEVAILLSLFLVAWISFYLFFATLVTLLGLLLGVPIWTIFNTPARLLRWVSRGNRERNVGWLGFYFLVAGFFLQAWINFI